MFTQKFVVSNNDVDARFNLKVPAIYRYFQDVALLATKEAKVDSISLAKRNIDWVIIRMDVEILRLPKCDETIYVHTYPGKDMTFFYPRYFYITDENDNILVKSSSVWALIDSQTRKTIVDKDIIARLPGEENSLSLPLPNKISPIENPQFVENRKIHYHDLDFNNHMNNVRYVELLLDIHDQDFYAHYRPSFISLNYLKEIREKENVSVYTDGSNPETIAVKTNDHLSFLGKVTFIPY